MLGSRPGSQYTTQAICSSVALIKTHTGMTIITVLCIIIVIIIIIAVVVVDYVVALLYTSSSKIRDFCNISVNNTNTNTVTLQSHK